jgi:predicted NAD/FAD-dependent oxidoreductase
MNEHTENWDVIVIGAGAAGLGAAGLLRSRGIKVCIVDAAPRLGGRTATRREGSAVFDYGAQFIRATSEEEAAMARRWASLDLLEEWTDHLDHPADGTVDGPIYVGTGGMDNLMRGLASGLTIASRTCITDIIPMTAGWLLRDANRRIWKTRGVIVTAPVPHALMMLENIRHRLDPRLLERLEGVYYHPGLTVLAEYGSATTLPGPGGLWPIDGPVSWIADNWAKGVSPVRGSVTVQATPTYTETHIDDSDERIARDLLGACTEWLTDNEPTVRVHRWPYAYPTPTSNHSCLLTGIVGPLAIAGDAFGGGTVMGAFNSGMDAGEATHAVLTNASKAIARKSA